ncbi:unnamed protein product [Aspergillus oryzae var. brunneus]|uniref:Unnamed protein product n=2 Tax=Aspergillus oryzae TaxID=5062 RepID=A0AAN4YEK7_ASPOZ|nr:unnamed protein product [Aspergillus oryzae]GMG44085.1 unnamed protein product [Aspergillus oryzae var. brunneus]
MARRFLENGLEGNIYAKSNLKTADHNESPSPSGLVAPGGFPICVGSLPRERPVLSSAIYHPSLRQLPCSHDWQPALPLPANQDICRDLFYTLGTNYTSATNTPYVPQASNDSSATGPDASGISGLESFDVYAQLSFEPRRDFVNGSAPSDEGWHTEDASLGEPGKPYFIANNYGPKYLNSKHGAYQIIQPLVTNSQAQDTNFTLSTIILSRQRTSSSAPTWSTAGATAFEVLEGSVQIQIGDYPVAQLEMGDVAFVPATVSYSYWTEGSYAKVLSVNAGQDGLNQQLIAEGKDWGYPTFPRY